MQYEIDISHYRDGRRRRDHRHGDGAAVRTVVMWLWNWLMPAIFGLTTISFWQAWGLVVLSHILFKSFPHHKEHGHHDEYWKRRFKDKFHPPAEEKANPEGDGIPEN